MFTFTISATYSSTLYDSFLSKNVKSPYIIPTRSFKSRRSNIETQTSLFDQQSREPKLDSNSIRHELGSIFKDLSPHQVIANEQVNSKTNKMDGLKPEDQEKLDLGEFTLRFF